MPSSPNGNARNTTYDQPIAGGHGISGDATIYNGYSIIPPYSGAVNSTNVLYSQQPLIIGMGGPTYMNGSQNMSSQC